MDNDDDSDDDDEADDEEEDDDHRDDDVNKFSASVLVCLRRDATRLD